MKTIFIGIDPGKMGGIAVLSFGIISIYKYPGTTIDLKNIFRGYDPSKCFAILEKQHAFPGQGVVSTGKIMQNYGIYQGILIALEIAFKEVSAATWMKTYPQGPVKPKSLTKPKKKDYPIEEEYKQQTKKYKSAINKLKTTKKNHLKSIAQQYYPIRAKKITLQTSDAVLIAIYAQHLYNSDLKGVL
jgi:hypothetical protein